ncbi:hypothetical protein K458DRAFT_437420 [Lentithecium fluviatile CBS 122367]|uniref:Prion-inhibition and propagation HeLo domain-containing protein n=1 Tax=Lentithecium fluviatile CBS 122367 TaxID=1168545 RepID=A0A6G1IE64_9PLEO|nr:hypothetical protein K458DRAFT_437420 [Lentithecium fluviatile CBS 122367]
MSGLELPAFLIEAAGLFSFYVDDFAYFKAAQRAEDEVETALLKLDIEKTRFLFWGNEIGMFSGHRQHPRLFDEAAVQLLFRILSKLHSLFTDSEQLRASYSVATQEVSRTKAVDLPKATLSSARHQAGFGHDTPLNSEPTANFKDRI